MQKCEQRIKIYKVPTFPLIALTHRVIASRLCEMALISSLFLSNERYFHIVTGDVKL